MKIWLLFFCPSYCIFYAINCVFLNWCRYSFVSLLFIILLVHMVKQWNIIFYFIFFIRYQNTSEPYICYQILFQERLPHHPPKPLPPSPLKWLHIDETWKEFGHQAQAEWDQLSAVVHSRFLVQNITNPGQAINYNILLIRLVDSHYFITIFVRIRQLNWRINSAF